MNHSLGRAELIRQSRVILKRKCKKLKISGEGNKTDIINRILHVMEERNILQPNVVNPPPEMNVPRVDDRKLRLQRRLHYSPQCDVLITKRRKKGGKKGKKPKKKYLTLCFVGIRPSNAYQFRNFISSYIDDIKIKSLHIKTSLVSTSTVSQLKKCIKSMYSISARYDILILYSHMIISNHNRATLRHFGVSDHSLLTIAICRDGIRSNSDLYSHQYLLRSLNSTQQQLDTDGIQTGFDIITQETGVTVYKMPVCGHLMSKESLYLYAISYFMNPSNVYLKCPHTKDDDDVKYNEENNNLWSCAQCTYINHDALNQRRGRSDDCAMCNHPKPRHISHAGNQCNVLWNYASIKSILLSSNDGSDALDLRKLELLSARNQLLQHKNKLLNVQKCYHCKTLYCKSKPHKSALHNANAYSKFRTKCVFCKRVFCWNCSKQYDRNHQCDGAFQLQIAHLLKTCATKTVGYVTDVPIIRCCPNTNCAQLITHISACKHIKCRSCSLSFCFVCMKPNVNGRWQCGGSSDRCPVAPRQNLRTLNKGRKINVCLKKAFQLLD